MKVSDRSTAELVIIYLAGIVGVILLIAEIGVFVLATLRPEANIEPLAQSVSETTSVVLGAVVGYIAGRNVKGNAG